MIRKIENNQPNVLKQTYL